MSDAMTTQLPTDATKRKEIPITRGCLDYFPAALAAVAELSRVANEQHNPGQEMHWARGKSTDHADCLVRHLMDRGTIDTDGIRHTAKVAWRALALLQEELEAAGAPLARGAQLATPAPAEPEQPMCFECRHRYRHWDDEDTCGVCISPEGIKRHFAAREDAP